MDKKIMWIAFREMAQPKCGWLKFFVDGHFRTWTHETGSVSELMKLEFGAWNITKIMDFPPIFLPDIGPWNKFYKSPG